MRSFLAALLAIVFLGAVVAWFARASPSRLPLIRGAAGESAQAYRSSAYNYSFSYPQHDEVREIAPEFVAIGDTSSGNFAPKADVAVLHAGISEPLPSYEDFVRLTVTLACQVRTGDCAYVSKTPYTTPGGLTGDVWYLKRNGESRGPFYTFDVSSNVPQNKYAVLIIYPPSDLPSSQMDGGLLKAIADSVRIQKAGG